MLSAATRARLGVSAGPDVARRWDRALADHPALLGRMTTAERLFLSEKFVAAALELSDIPEAEVADAWLATPEVAALQHLVSDWRDRLPIDHFHLAVSTLQFAVRTHVAEDAATQPEEALSLYEAINRILDAVMRETAQEWAFQQSEIRRLKLELEGLYRIADAATGDIEASGLLEVVAREVATALSADLVAILVPDTDDEEPDTASVTTLAIRAMKAPEGMDRLLAGMTFRLADGGALAEAWKSGNLVVSTTPATDLHVTLRRRQTLETLGFHHMLVAPLRMQNEVLGLAFVANNAPERTFDSEARHLIGTMGAQAASAMRNVSLIARNRALSRDLVFALSQALDARDSYTHNHSANVATLGRRIAEEMGLSTQECEDIYIAGLLHDIGKIGIADSVLHKPGPLNRAERQLMMLHPVKGADILGPVRGLGHLVPCVRHHHERWDGNGYPAGLKGDEIPLGGRILAMADAYDVMNNHRVYRRSRSPEEILREIKAMSGKQFDPRVVEVMLRLVEQEGITNLTPNSGSVMPEEGTYYPVRGNEIEGEHDLLPVNRLLEQMTRLGAPDIRLESRGNAADTPDDPWRRVPLTLGRASIGEMCVPRQLDSATVEELTHSVQDLVGRHGSLETQLRQFRELAAVSARMNSASSAEQVLQYAVEAAKKLVGADTAAFWEARDEHHLQCAAAVGKSRWSWQGTVPLGHDGGIEAYVAYRRITTAVVDYLTEDRFKVPSWVQEDGIRSALATPVELGLRLIGILSVMTYEETAFSNEEIELLNALGHATASAYENARLRNQARHLEASDPLTGWLNHRGLQERLAREAAQALDRNAVLACVLFDVDHFAGLNLQHGFAVGDELLRQVTGIAAHHAPPKAVLGRVGGVEFAMVLQGANRSEVFDAADKLADAFRQSIATSHFPGPQSSAVRLTISLGIAVWPDCGADIQSLLLAARSAMRQAKASGRNQTARWQPRN
ncbi:MAG: HD domain-containing phosphohydrolase [Candidatus Sericytochromatia bacterium]|nr:HD domain-containing phosphohydrolase [Candidatus Sericytochromatia bacterium]